MSLGRRLAIPLILTALGVSWPAAADARQTDDWYAQGAFRPLQRIALTVSNPLDEARAHAPVIVTPDQVPALAGLHELYVTLVDPRGEPRPEPDRRRRAQEGPHGFLAEAGGRAVFFQMDDLDRDGLWDELFFQIDLQPGETRTIHAYIGFNQRGWNPHRTHAAIGSYARHLVPFWESENVGWKLWFPTDVDVYGKREPLLMSQRLYMDNLDGYAVSYLDPAYGSDIMSVDNSFGGGGVGLFEDPARPDVVSKPRFTPGNAEVADTNFNLNQADDTRYAFEVVANGPLRSMIRVRTMNWRSGSGAYELEQLYTAYAHQSYSTARVRFTTFEPDDPGTAFAAGIRRHPNESIRHQQGGVVITGGREAIRNPDDRDAVQNALEVDFAASALIVRDDLRPEYVFAPGYQGNHLFRIPVTEDRTFEYMIAAAWSEGHVLNTPEAFQDYVLAAARGYNAPVRVTGGALETRSDQ